MIPYIKETKINKEQIVVELLVMAIMLIGFTLMLVYLPTNNLDKLNLLMWILEGSLISFGLTLWVFHLLEYLESTRTIRGFNKLTRLLEGKRW